jgi:hypothetical protein
VNLGALACAGDPPTPTSALRTRSLRHRTLIVGSNGAAPFISGAQPLASTAVNGLHHDTEVPSERDPVPFPIVPLTRPCAPHRACPT